MELRRRERGEGRQRVMDGVSASDLRLSPAKRRKTGASSLSSTGKGKEKMVEEETQPAAAAAGDDTDFDLELDKTCGICLSGVGNGHLIRGEIDSCDHFFCFVCIMEWAKVESRCPCCKRRFRNIRRHPAVGIFPSERVVEIPLRDQVYHPLGNESTRNSDPYANTNCSVCQGSKDEELLLLCDLCDAAAHTFCVDLGTTVPSGDWYCSDCSACRYEHSNNQNNEDTCNQDPNKIISTLQALEAPHFGSSPNRVSDVPVSIFDIVAEERPAEISTSRREESRSFTEQMSSPTRSVLKAALSSQGARTLRNCRNLCDRVQVLRENWTAIRSGTLGFSSGLFDSTALASERDRNGHKTTGHILTEPDPSSVVNSEQIRSSSASNSRGPQDANEAWKKMEIAKAKEKTPRGSNKSVLKESKRISCSRAPAHNVAVKMIREENRSISLRVVHHGESQHGTKRKMDVQIAKKVPHLVTGQKNNDVAIHIKKASVKQDISSKQGNVYVGKSMPDHQRIETLLPILYNKQEGPRNPIALSSSVSSASTSSFREPTEFSSLASEPYCLKDNRIEENSTTLSCTGNGTSKVRPSDKVKVDLLGKVQHENNITDADERSVRTNTSSDAKSEVQALVKLNLKLLNRDRQLDAGGFKEVARVATHTILAACGLEHSRSIARPFSSSICKHSEEIKMLSKSNLMPSSCRECFYTFIQEVVNSVFLEKNSHRLSSG